MIPIYILKQYILVDTVDTGTILTTLEWRHTNVKAPTVMPPQAAPPMRPCLRTKRVGDLSFGVVGCGF